MGVPDRQGHEQKGNGREEEDGMVNARACSCPIYLAKFGTEIQGKRRG